MLPTELLLKISKYLSLPNQINLKRAGLPGLPLVYNRTITNIRSVPSFVLFKKINHLQFDNTELSC